MKVLVGGTRRVALLDLLIGPRLSAAGPGRLGVLLALLGPGDGEPGVQDATGEQRRRRRIDGRQRRDRLEGGRIELRNEQLADCTVGDAHHSDLVVQDPRLVGNRLDDVIPVEILQRFEEVERPARTTGAPHVDVDHRKSHEIGENGDPILRSGRIRVAVARILDKRWVRRKVVSGAIRHRSASGQSGLTGRVSRRMYVDGELRPVTGREVLVSVVRDLLVVDARIPRSSGTGVHDEGRRLLSV